MRVGILGAGSIAGTLSRTINQLNDPNIVLYAVGARDLERAKKFAEEHKIPKAYGSYEELVSDKDVDLIYVATPHSHHYQHTKLAVMHGKNCLVEKAFMANAAQAKEILQLAEEKKVLVTEAIWTRYMPSRRVIDSIIKSGEIGEVHAVQANLGYALAHVERLNKPELAGGALLDLGVYTINFALMALGDDVQDVQAHCVKGQYGCDTMDSITLTFKDGKMAVLHANMLSITDKNGYIFGDKGYIFVNDINNPKEVAVYNNERKLVKEYPLPKQVTGYEYQLIECNETLKKGAIECESMPHKETIFVMELMDKIRAQFGIKYPFE